MKPAAAYGGPARVQGAAYLNQLTAWDYTLSEVEQIVIDTIEARRQSGDEAPDVDADDNPDAQADDQDEAEHSVGPGTEAGPPIATRFQTDISLKAACVRKARPAGTAAPQRSRSQQHTSAGRARRPGQWRPPRGAQCS